MSNPHTPALAIIRQRLAEYLGRCETHTDALMVADLGKTLLRIRAEVDDLENTEAGR